MRLFDRFWNKMLGKSGEDIAASYLKKKGYRILARNFRTDGGEIDIIAFDGKQIVFVEVKTRTNPKGVYPEDAVNDVKLNKIVRTGHIYIRHNRLQQYPWRIDIIAVERHDDVLSVTRHICGA